MLTRARVAWAIVVWWLPQPVWAWWFYRVELDLGAYPVDADSIGLPIVMFLMGWLTVTPVMVFLVWWIATRAARGPLSWLAFDRGHAFWCVLWSLFLAVAVFGQVRAVWLSLVDGFLVDAGVNLFGASALLAARAALCAPRALIPEPAAAPVGL